MEWSTVIFSFVAIPIAVILGIVLIATVAIRSWHNTKMMRLKMEEQERQAEMDKELLGIGGGGISAHIDTILSRLNNIEQRLDRIEVTGRNVSSTSSASASATQHREDQTQIN